MTNESAKIPTLYEWAGGLDALRGMIDAFYDRVEHLDLFDSLFPKGVTEEHRDFVTAWWAEVFGGPPRYTGRSRWLREHVGSPPEPSDHSGTAGRLCVNNEHRSRRRRVAS